ncbi:MAG: arginine--tRNA ligase [Alphaproteobacteria bacterium]|nr:arginine--tRNA ligase [Alphaproteobacteria bacterium]
MNLLLENKINAAMADIFNQLGLDTRFAFVKMSDRPDLSDFQCNGALALAKTAHKNPREIAAAIVSELQKCDFVETLSVDGPGFINIKLKNEFIAQNTDKIAQDERLGCGTTENPHRVVLDYGGPNVAKEMHVGHLRSGVIGEAIRRIERFIGNDVIGDVHLGDWGTPMGMILAEIMRQDGNLDKVTTYDIAQITEFYKRANIRCKEDETAKETARKITAALQDGDAVLRAAWQHLRNESVKAIKENYAKLDVNFDLWWGESDAHETCGKIVELARQKGVSEVDNGAVIIRLEEGNKPKPPVILVKSDGGYTYHTTDIATIKMRVDDLKAQEIVYFTDSRQALHFEQVFEGVQKLGIAPNVGLKHIVFGTVNGADGKPFKTRDGGVMNLETLIEMSKDKVRQSLPKAGEIEGYGEAEIEKMVSQIAVAAIKFQDLKNTINSGYVFELDDFAKFEGKTGPYIQYAIARINSVLRKAQANGLEPANVVLQAPEERTLALKLAQLHNVVMRAHSEKEPSIIADYTYSLAQTFSTFYNACPIMSAGNTALASSRLRLAKLVRDVLTLMLYLLGIEAPEVMLKAENKGEE